VVGFAKGWRVGGSNSGGSETFRTMGPTLPLVQWVLGFFHGSKVAGAWR